MKKPFNVWITLWFFTPLLMSIINAVMKHGQLVYSPLAQLVLAVVMGVVFVLLSLIVWFIGKLIYKVVTKKAEFDTKQVVAIWIVLTLILNTLVLYKK